MANAQKQRQASSTQSHIGLQDTAYGDNNIRRINSSRSAGMQQIYQGGQPYLTPVNFPQAHTGMPTGGTAPAQQGPYNQEAPSSQRVESEPPTRPQTIAAAKSWNIFARFRCFGSYAPPSLDLKYDLPTTVTSVRDGWQWTCNSGAVVSGLLASVAAQLLTQFKSPAPGSNPAAQEFLVICGYAAIFLNISATISSFILIDNLGEIGFRASGGRGKNFDTVGSASYTQDRLLVEFGASKQWTFMLIHWLVTFYLGILTLIVAVFTYVLMNESLATKITMGIIVSTNLFLVSYFIFIRPLFFES